MSGRMVSADASPALPWRTGEPTLQASWFDEAWEASLSFIKGECNGPAAILLDVALGMVPVVGQIIDARDIILGLIDVSEQPEDADAWFNLITALIGLVPGGGDALKRALRAIHRLQAPADTLLAMLRGFGRGNVEKLVLDMLDVSRIKGSMQILQATLRSNGFLQTLSAGTRQRILHTASRLQVGLERQFVQFEKQVRGWLKRQPNTSVEPEYVSKTVAKKADKTNAKPGVAIESKEHSNVAHAGRHNVYLHDIDDSAITSMYYPKDLVAYARSVAPPPPEGTAAAMTGRLRCEAGHVCPHSGWWSTPALGHELRSFRQGALMPEIDSNSWGLTIWYFDQANQPAP